MSWTRSEAKWDSECTQPAMHNNDGARFGQQLFRDHFGIEVATGKPITTHQSNNNNFSVYSSGDGWD